MSAPSSDLVTVERPSPDVALATLRSAGRFNTLGLETLDALEAELIRCFEDSDVRAVVLTGGGESFATGADLREVAGLGPREALAFAGRGQALFDAVERAATPVLAAIDGYCLGGGLDLALACDARHASPRSVFAHPGATLGILTGFGGTARLPRLVGRGRAIELFATGRRLGAAEAYEIGLVDALSDDPVASTLASARAIAERPRDEVAAIKRACIAAFRSGRR